VLVLLEVFVLEPYIMKRTARVRSWASLLAPDVLGVVWRFWGVLVAPPLLAIVYAYRARGKGSATHSR
jgi:predicted PurR-regulated permease PerM